MRRTIETVSVEDCERDSEEAIQAALQKGKTKRKNPFQKGKTKRKNPFQNMEPNRTRNEFILFQ